MADGQQYDTSAASQDEGFRNASMADKIAYLSAHDADFAKAPTIDKAGYINHLLGNDQPTQFEKDNAAPTGLQAGNEMAGKILKNAGMPTSFADIPRWAGNMTGNALSRFGLNDPNYKPMWSAAQEAYNNPTQENIVGAVPFIGPTAVDAAHEPTLMGKAGAITGGVMGGIGAGEVKPGLKAAKTQLAETVRTPEGKLNRPTKVAASLAGGVVGHYTGGGTGLGELGGLFQGAGVADALLPDLPKKQPMYSAYEEPPHPVYGPSTPTAAQFRLSQKMAPAPEEPPTYPGAPLPSTDDFYSARGQEINALRKMQPDAFSPPQSKAPLGDIPSEEGVKGSVPKPSGRLVLLPQEAAAMDRMQQIAKVRASQHGTMYAAGMRPAGGGRVPMTATGITTTEYPGPRPDIGEDAYNPPTPEALQGNPSPFALSEEDMAAIARRKKGKTGIEGSGLI